MSYGDGRGSKINQKTATYHLNGQKVYKFLKQFFILNVLKGPQK